MVALAGLRTLGFERIAPIGALHPEHEYSPNKASVEVAKASKLSSLELYIGQCFGPAVDDTKARSATRSTPS